MAKVESPSNNLVIEQQKQLIAVVTSITRD